MEPKGLLEGGDIVFDNRDEWGDVMFDNNDDSNIKKSIELIESRDPRDSLKESKEVTYKKMKTITPKIAKTFTEDEKWLFKGDLLDENKQWTEEAKKLVVELVLKTQQKEMVELAKEVVKEEREQMMMGLGRKSA